MGNKRYSDEAIVTALIAEGSIKGAAAYLHCKPRTIYDRMKTPSFKALYDQAKGEILKTVTAQIQGELSNSVKTLADIRDDKDAPKQTRANCATSLLQYGARFTEQTDILTRLEAIEEAQAIKNEI